jgi:hypothetical protein
VLTHFINDGQSSTQQMYHARKILPPPGKLFVFGQADTSITLWKTDGWYYWTMMQTPLVREEVAPVPDAEKKEEGNGAQLPRKYQRFWQGGPPQ